MALVKIVIQKTVHAPSVLGPDPAYAGDSLSVHEETASELIASGFAESEEALASKEAEAAKERARK